MTNYTLTFEPSQKQGNFPQGVSIRDAALELGILIESPCAGLGFCGKCKVKIPDGAGPVTAAERVKLTQDELDSNVRLACQATLQSDITCVIPQENQVLPEQISVAGLQGHFPLNPDVQAISLNVPKPQLSDKYFLWEALQQELQKSGYSQVQPTLVNLTQLQKASSQSSGEFTVVMFQEELLEITTENVQTNLYGIAIDIGTTTVVMKLLELKTGKVLGVRSAENRQYQYGADVISRLNYVESHDDGLHQLHNLIIGQLNDLTETLTTLTGISQAQIYSAVITGNTVMQHLFLGINPLSLASAPYYPVFQGSVITAASALDLQFKPTHESGPSQTSPRSLVGTSQAF